MEIYGGREMIMPGKIVSRLDKMLTDAIDGSFIESDYDETELSRLESKFRRYLAEKELASEKIQEERNVIKELVTDISHQTKTPLSNICLYTQLLEETCTKDMLPYVQQIHMYADKLEFFIKALSKISMLESSMIKLNPQMYPVARLVNGSVSYAKCMADRKHITIDVTNKEDACALYDERWTHEALGNLLDNAVKYSPVGSTVTVSVKNMEMFSCIMVEDEGIGIPEEERAQIFKRFYRGRNVIQEEGNGIGLYLSRIIIQKEGGYIKVSSGSNGGSCFSMYLLKKQ